MEDSEPTMDWSPIPPRLIATWTDFISITSMTSTEGTQATQCIIALLVADAGSLGLERSGFDVFVCAFVSVCEAY